MRKIIAYCPGPTVGCDTYEAFSYPDDYTDEEISKDLFSWAAEHYERYGYDEDEEYFEFEIDYSFEDYDPEKHDGLRAGGGSFEDAF